VIWGLFIVGVFLAAWLSFYGLRPAPPRTPVTPESAKRSTETHTIEQDWKGPSGLLHFKVFLTPSMAEVRYALSGTSPLEVHFVSFSVSSKGEYKEIFREDSPWETLEPGQSAIHQYTLAGSVTLKAALTFEYRASGKVIQDTVTFGG
jgi:hypothetical protein